MFRHSPDWVGRPRVTTYPGQLALGWLPSPGSRWLLWAAIAVAAGAGAATAIGPLKAMAGLAVLLLVAAVCRWPALAAYLVVTVTPLTVGISTGAAVPVRPNEVLDVLVAGGLAVGGLARLRTGRIPRLRMDGVEWSILLMAVCNSALPLLVMDIRQHPVSRDDLLYALVMWKLLALYAIVRLSVRTGQQIRRCLWLSVAAGCVVALVAIAQSLDVSGVSGLVSTYFTQTESGPVAPGARGSSTLGLPAATADLMVFNLAIVSGLWTRYRRHPLILGAAAALFVFGTLAAGEFSGYIGLAAGVVCIAIVTRSARLLAPFIPVGLAGAAVLRPVIARRLSGFSSPYRLPASWLGRLSNLRTYFWPKLFSGWNFVLGVRPAARAHVTTQSLGYVWIESGYTWLLWAGGIPLLASYVFFVVAAAKRGWVAARHGAGAMSIAGAAAFTAVLVTAVLMLFDPHLTYRGSADLLFVLIALAAPRPDSPRTAHPGGMPETSRTAWRGGSIVPSEDKARSTASGAAADGRSAFSPDGNARRPGEPAGSRAGADRQVTGVNPAAARRGPRVPGQIPRFLRVHLTSMVAIALAVTAGAALLAGLQTREYKSQAVVVVYPSPSEAGTGIQAALMATEQAMALSGDVVGNAASGLRVPESTLYHGLSVSSPANSYLLDIAVTDPTPQVAQRNAQAVAEAYVTYRTFPHRPTSNSNRTMFVPPVGSVEAAIVSPAPLPVTPSSPNAGLDIAVGVILGIVLGLSFALVRDRMDDRLRGSADLEAQSGAPVLAVVPVVRDTSPGPAADLAVLHAPGSASADSFRDLRTRVVQAAAWQDARTVLVASPAGEEDEALVAANLAAALALAGRRVVLVCADPRRTRTQEPFGVAAGTGLTGVRGGDATLATAIQRTGVPRLEILPRDAGSGGWGAMAEASGLRAVIREIRGRADFAIIDAPPVLSGPETGVLAEIADMVLLAANTRESTRAGVRSAAREIGQVRGSPEGSVLIAVRRNRRLPKIGAKPPGWLWWKLAQRRLPALLRRPLPASLRRLLPRRRTGSEVPAPSTAAAPDPVREER